nr:SDR family NAD(P)-dependent oxidoreductase [Hymenobacter volaticus]
MTTDQNEPRPTNSEINPKPMPYPTSQEDMEEQPDWDMSNYLPAGKLKGKVALITGGDSGIGRAVALAFAMEGADVAVVYQTNADDAAVVGKAVEAQGRKFLAIQADVRSGDACREAARQTNAELGAINILVNNAAYQQGYESFETIPEENIHRTFDTNIKGYIFMAQSVLPYMNEGIPSSIPAVLLALSATNTRSTTPPQKPLFTSLLRAWPPTWAKRKSG